MRLQSSRASVTLTVRQLQRRWFTDRRPFAPDDLVLLRQNSNRSAPPILSRPLAPGRRIETHRGFIKHEDIIGRRVRDVVRSSITRSSKEGTEFRLHQVTLEEYVKLSKRLVTPIYPPDANLIVSLLDLHPAAFLEAHDGQAQHSKLEILEAGTGHGALTLYLSRAIHAANVRLLDKHEHSEMDEWKAQRKAVIHTIDVSPTYSAHAESNVRGFKHGIYAGNVDFHVGDVGQWLQTQYSNRGSIPFLSHIFLDLPAAERHLSTASKALNIDGTLIIFNPSITQISNCATEIKDDAIPLDLDKVIELGVNGGSGGREWDVRFVKPRAKEPSRATDPVPREEADVGSSTGGSDDWQATEALILDGAEQSKDRWSLVCRPKVGDRITGGGFLGVWKKRRDWMRNNGSTPKHPE